jgi:hypothetical protein
MTDLFDDRYGENARVRLVALLRQPCASFADIADAFGVSRERVRQWHAEILPDAPRGRERRRLCGLSHQRRQLFADPLFRTFYRHARSSFARDQLRLVPTGSGFRKRAVTLGGAAVALKIARPVADRGTGAPGYFVAGYRGPAAFVYCRLSDADFLFLPAAALPPGGTTFVDTPASKYHAFKNSFAALTAAAPRRIESNRTPRRGAEASAPPKTRCAASNG